MSPVASASTLVAVDSSAVDRWYLTDHAVEQSALHLYDVAVVRWPKAMRQHSLVKQNLGNNKVT